MNTNDTQDPIGFDGSVLDCAQALLAAPLVAILITLAILAIGAVAFLERSTR